MESANFVIEGMTCGNCVAHVKRALAALDGVKTETVEVGSAVVSYDPAVIEPSVIERTLAEEGYPAHFVSVNPER